MPFAERPLTLELQEESQELAKDGAGLLQLYSEDDPAVLVAAIDEHINATRPLAGDALLDEAVALGCLWGTQVCRALDWEWVQLDDGRLEPHYAIVSPDRAFAILPTSYIRGLLADAERDNTALLLYNMLVAGNVPSSVPKSYYLLG
jgi:hypothetical protein